jgi:hypothetical protein
VTVAVLRPERWRSVKIARRRDVARIRSIRQEDVEPKAVFLTGNSAPGAVVPKFLTDSFESVRCAVSCGNSSVGRARPCQGRGREFESRFPLQVSARTPIERSGFLRLRRVFFSTAPAARGARLHGIAWTRCDALLSNRTGQAVSLPARATTRSPNDASGLVAEWSCSGLQSRVRRFNSDPGLQFLQVSGHNPDAWKESPPLRGLFFCDRERS